MITLPVSTVRVSAYFLFFFLLAAPDHQLETKCSLVYHGQEDRGDCLHLEKEEAYSSM